MLGGGEVVSVDVVVNGGTVVDVSNMLVPLEFVMPRPTNVCEAQKAAATRCVWRSPTTQKLQTQ